MVSPEIENSEKINYWENYQTENSYAITINNKNYEDLYFQNLLIHFWILGFLILAGVWFVVFKYVKATNNDFFEQNFFSLKISDKKYFIIVFVSSLLLVFISPLFLLLLSVYFIWFFLAKIKIADKNEILTIDEIKNFDKIFSKDILWYFLTNIIVSILTIFIFQIIFWMLHRISESSTVSADNKLWMIIFSFLSTLVCTFLLNISRVKSYYLFWNKLLWSYTRFSVLLSVIIFLVIMISSGTYRIYVNF